MAKKKPLQALGKAFDEEIGRWDWRRDRLTGQYSVIRIRDMNTQAYDTILDVADIHAATSLTQEMSQEAAARAGLKALASSDLASLQGLPFIAATGGTAATALDAHTLEIFAAVCRTIAEKG